VRNFSKRHEKKNREEKNKNREEKNKKKEKEEKNTKKEKTPLFELIYKKRIEI